MKDILRRDITGKCVGECKDRVYMAEEERQAKIDRMQSDHDRRHLRSRRS